MDEIVIGCACDDTGIGDPVGEPSWAEPNCRARDNRGVAVFAAGGGVVLGTARDFQYVSTAPPISSVTPSNGVMMLISKVTCKGKPIVRQKWKNKP
jgi:hypothetical protein